MEENERPQTDQTQEMEKATKRRQLEERRAAYYEERTRKLEEENKRKLEEEKRRAKEAGEKANQAKQKMLALMRQKQMMRKMGRAA